MNGAEFRRLDAKLQRETRERDGGVCQAVGCEQPGDPHHIEPKGMGGRTLVPLELRATLCGMHHRLIHDEGRRLILKDGRTIGPRGVVDERGVSTLL